MTTLSAVSDMLAQRTWALVGLSRSGSKFSNMALAELRKKGLKVLGVNPQATEVKGEPCYPSLSALPEPAGAALIMVPPSQAEQAVRDAAAAGIRHVWLQQGSESAGALVAARELGLNTVAGECIFMFLSPVGFPHSLHRLIWSLLGKLPR